jgi:hypothetical protein
MSEVSWRYRLERCDEACLPRNMNVVECPNVTLCCLFRTGVVHSWEMSSIATVCLEIAVSGVECPLRNWL